MLYAPASLCSVDIHMVSSLRGGAASWSTGMSSAMVSSTVWIDSECSVHCLSLWVDWFSILHPGFPFEMLFSSFFFPFLESPARVSTNVVFRELDN